MSEAGFSDRTLGTLLVDAGGTSTSLCFQSAHGEQKTLQLGPLNYQLQGEAGVRKLFSEALTQLAINPSQASVLAGIAGAGRKEDQREIRSILSSLGFDDEHLEITGDDRLYLRALGGDGIVYIAGTGSICRGQKGSAEAFAGGWGLAIGGGAASREVASVAIRYALYSYEGSKPDSTLKQLVCDHFSLKSPADIVRPIHAGKFPPQELAAIAPKVLAAASAGDLLATEIVDLVSARGAEMVLCVANKLQFKQAQLALVGGMVLAELGEIYRQRLLRLIENKGISFELKELDFQTLTSRLLERQS